MSQSRYSIIPTAALEDERVSATELRVLAVIGSYLDKNREAYPKQATIAERAKCSRQTVNNAIKNLSSYGYLKTFGSPKGKLKRALKYEVILDVKKDDIEAETVITADVKKDDIDVGIFDNDVKPRLDNRCKAQGLTAIEDTQVKIPTQPRASAKSVCDEILKLLPPRKRAMAPRDSLPKVVKTILRSTDPESLLSAVRRCYGQERNQAEEGQYAPAIYSWLKNGVWKNWLDESLESKAPELETEEWAQAMRHWVDTGEWLIDLHSPAPHEPGTKVPAGMLRHALKQISGDAEKVAGIEANLRPEAA